jgi:outer membrane protein assembly factor BamE (lipoprotein component of BamABCDE complex)
MRTNRTALVIAMVAIATGCASFERTRGVESTWRDPATPAPVVGTTTQTDILAALGPPSQVIGLRDQTVFYYLKENDKGRGALLIVYNWLKEDVTYDRAIFFFDAQGVLQDYGFSDEPGDETN